MAWLSSKTITPSKSEPSHSTICWTRETFSLARVGPQRGVGGEQDALLQPDRRALAEARQRRDQQPLHAERRPVALRILDQLVGLRDPDRAAAALQPVVEQDAGDLAALAGAGAVAQKPAAAEAHGVLGVIGRGRDDIEGLVDRPGSGEMAAMGLAGIDDAFELGVGQEAIGDDVGRQVRPIGRLRRRDRGHRGRLHELGRMRLRTGDADRLQRVCLIERIGQAAALGRRPVDGLIGELDAAGLERCAPRSDVAAWRRRGLGADGCRGRSAAEADWRPSRQAGAAARAAATQPSNVATSGAMPGDAGNDVGSSAGQPVDDGQPRLDRRAVPGIDRARRSPAENTTRPRSCRRTKASRQAG